MMHRTGYALKINMQHLFTHNVRIGDEIYDFFCLFVISPNQPRKKQKKKFQHHHRLNFRSIRHINSQPTDADTHLFTFDAIFCGQQHLWLCRRKNYLWLWTVDSANGKKTQHTTNRIKKYMPQCSLCMRHCVFCALCMSGSSSVCASDFDRFLSRIFHLLHIFALAVLFFAYTFARQHQSREAFFRVIERLRFAKLIN